MLICALQIPQVSHLAVFSFYVEGNFLYKILSNGLQLIFSYFDHSSWRFFPRFQMLRILWGLEQTFLCKIIIQNNSFGRYLEGTRTRIQGHVCVPKKFVTCDLKYSCALLALCAERESCWRPHFSFPKYS